MGWIEKLREELGDKVVVTEVRGHEHWGFRVGDTYDIVERENGRLGFRGYFDTERLINLSPSSNYAWAFTSALPISLENK